jgi:hypothetical protein
MQQLDFKFGSTLNKSFKEKVVDRDNKKAESQPYF